MRADIPLYTYRDVDFEIPVALTYSSNGLLPNVQAGSSGLGWFLSAGGTITREVNGFPDEAGGTWIRQFIEGFDAYTKEMPAVTAPLMQKITHFDNYPAMYDGTRYYETTPDIFRFNFLGHRVPSSGRMTESRFSIRRIPRVSIALRSTSRG